MEFPFLTLVGHANGWYLEALCSVMQNGERVTTRGRTTWEILHALTKLPDPRRRVLTVPYRRANPFFQALETVWILAGRSDAEWLLYYNSQMAKYLDSGSDHFHGAYGERLRRWGEHNRYAYRSPYGQRDQIADVIEQLQVEASSRRAVATIHNPAFDNTNESTLDRPCNIAVSYQLRGGRLHAVTFNRSNDLNLGLAFTNICQFTTIQEFIAAALGVDVADYVHFSSSLHVYEDDPIVKRLLKPLIRSKPFAELSSEELASWAHTPGQIVRQQPEIEVVPAARFDVYDHVSPLPMGKWHTPHDGWTNIMLLDKIGDSQSRADMDESKARLFDISCPYWSSIGRMAMAWHALKDEDGLPGANLAEVLGYLGYMEARDWQIACLEFLHRWACKRGIRREFQAMITAYVPFDEWPEPVRQFVLHDEGEK